MEASEKEEYINYLPYILMTITVLFWGVSWPMGRIVSSEFGSNVFTAAFIRFSFALPVLLVITKFKEGSLSVPREVQPKLIILGLMQIALYNFLYLSGLRFTSASDASLIIAINPTLTAIWASQVYDDERMNSKRVGGLLLAFAGVVLIFIESPNTQVENRILGDLFIFGGALVWSLYSTFSRPVFKKVSPLKFQLWASIYGWIALGLVSLTEQPWNQTYNPIGLGALLYLGIFAAALSNTFFSYGISKIGPTHTSTFVNFVPVVAVISSVLILGEKFSFLYVFAFVFIAFGVRTVNKS